ncbi:sigma-54 dependent transcriptional regulator [uncultured Desulfuromusa sp.]|uniref:sigma-54-dependent transcriptional regulator n=1 Tax=uncultured Desulfuromusa sp. TaxID=219183 RepID=UPI002AA8D249|nr:sigma-54 dependent transcriptional regulator [uncultured Desulfuromusa sp.]
MRKNGRILLLDDDELIISMLSRALRKEGYETHLLHSSVMAVEKIIAWQPDMMLLDIELGEDLNGLDILRMLQEEHVKFPIVMLTGDDSSDSAIKALRYGASDYLHKPFNVEEVKIVVDRILQNSRMHDEIAYLKRANVEKNGQEFVGKSPVILKLLKDAQKIAAAGVNSMLITGKSGTGKEVLARNLHYWRFAGQDDFESIPYIAINCTALPENLIEGELFGHVKGAFTDAKTDKKGVFELANGGTLLLDEIGDMRADLQGKLLRVLEERSVRRVGGKVDLPIDITIIASTNRNLKELVADGLFREDLYYRLSSFLIEIPPLHDRGTDVVLLARHFLQTYAKKYAKKEVTAIDKEAEKLLLDYAWPGNVRELRNVIERCVVMEEASVLKADCLPLDMGGRRSGSIERRGHFQIILPEKGISLEDVEKELLQLALERTNNNMTQAAKLLKISYDSFRYQAKKYSLL